MFILASFKKKKKEESFQKLIKKKMIKYFLFLFLKSFKFFNLNTYLALFLQQNLNFKQIYLRKREKK